MEGSRGFGDSNNGELSINLECKPKGKTCWGKHVSVWAITWAEGLNCSAERTREMSTQRHCALHTHSTSYFNAILKFPLQAICTEYKLIWKLKLFECLKKKKDSLQWICTGEHHRVPETHYCFILWLTGVTLFRLHISHGCLIWPILA